MTPALALDARAIALLATPISHQSMTMTMTISVLLMPPPQVGVTVRPFRAPPRISISSPLTSPMRLVSPLGCRSPLLTLRVARASQGVHSVSSTKRANSSATDVRPDNVDVHVVRASNTMALTIRYVGLHPATWTPCPCTAGGTQCNRPRYPCTGSVACAPPTPAFAPAPIATHHPVTLTRTNKKSPVIAKTSARPLQTRPAPLITHRLVLPLAAFPITTVCARGSLYRAHPECFFLAFFG